MYRGPGPIRGVPHPPHLRAKSEIMGEINPSGLNQRYYFGQNKDFGIAGMMVQGGSAIQMQNQANAQQIIDSSNIDPASIQQTSFTIQHQEPSITTAKSSIYLEKTPMTSVRVHRALKQLSASNH